MKKITFLEKANSPEGITVNESILFAKEGDRDAQLSYGISLLPEALHRHPKGGCHLLTNIEPNYELGINYLNLSAKALNIDALVILGSIYANGYGEVKPDNKAALECIRVAASLGSAIAQNNIGVFYWEGIAVEENYFEAMKWFRKAAKNGDAESEYNIGCMFLRGECMPRSEGFKWIKKAAKKGHLEAKDTIKKIKQHRAFAA